MNRLLPIFVASLLGAGIVTGAANAAQEQSQALSNQTNSSQTMMHKHHHYRGHGNRLARLDANHDGIVTRDEAVAAATARFDKLDTNHDGKIDQAETAALKQRAQERRDAMRAKWQARHAAPSTSPSTSSAK